MHHTPCTRRVIAAGDFALVERCACGSIHLTIGAVTMRLAGSALQEIATVLSAAAAKTEYDAFAAELAS